MNATMIVRSLLVVLSLAAYPAASYAGFWSVGLSVGIAPPPIPVYVQPPCPAPGYIWTPGYWAYADDDQDYYWVPGTWVYAPSPGLLWTPGYWAFEDAAYRWHAGYWGPHVGFYGGINYGFGYFGVGFAGGYWHGHDFFYNRAAANVTNISMTHVYSNTTVVNNFHGEHPSFNGPAGVHARPTAPELAAEHEPHRGWTGEQREHAQDAHALPGLLASSNHGHPSIAATPRAAAFQGNGVTATRPLPTGASNPRAAGTGGMRAAHAFAPPAADGHRAPAAPARDRTSGSAPRVIPAGSDRPAWASPGRPAPTPAVAGRPQPAGRRGAPWPEDGGGSSYRSAARTNGQPRAGYGSTSVSRAPAATVQPVVRSRQLPEASFRHATASPAPAAHASAARPTGTGPRVAPSRPQAAARNVPADANRTRR